MAVRILWHCFRCEKKDMDFFASWCWWWHLRGVRFRLWNWYHSSLNINCASFYSIFYTLLYAQDVSSKNIKFMVFMAFEAPWWLLQINVSCLWFFSTSKQKNHIFYQYDGKWSTTRNEIKMLLLVNFFWMKKLPFLRRAASQLSAHQSVVCVSQMHSLKGYIFCRLTRGLHSITSSIISVSFMIWHRRQHTQKRHLGYIFISHHHDIFSAHHGT